MPYPRFLTPRLIEAFQDTPLVLIKGARQVGKSTLAKELIDQLGGQSLSFDDPTLLSLAKADPRGFIDQLRTPVLLDEVQRAPEIVLPLKLRIDQNQEPGQWMESQWRKNFLKTPILSLIIAARAPKKS